MDPLNHQGRDKEKKTKQKTLWSSLSLPHRKKMFPLGYNLPLCGFEDLMYSIGIKKENSKQKK